MKQLSITNVTQFDLRELSQVINQTLLNDKLPDRIEDLTLQESFSLIQSIGSKQSFAAELCTTCEAELGFWRGEKQKLKLNDTPYTKEAIDIKITSENSRVDIVSKTFSALEKKYNCVAKMIRIVEQSR